MQGFGAKPEGRASLGRPRHRREANVKMDLQEVGFGDMDLFDLVQNSDRWRALINAVMNIQFPSNAGNFLTS